MGHAQDWGLKMVLTKVMTVSQLLTYALVLARITEECGGVKATLRPPTAPQVGEGA